MAVGFCHVQNRSLSDGILTSQFTLVLIVICEPFVRSLVVSQHLPPSPTNVLVVLMLFRQVRYLGLRLVLHITL